MLPLERACKSFSFRQSVFDGYCISIICINIAINVNIIDTNSIKIRLICEINYLKNPIGI